MSDPGAIQESLQQTVIHFATGTHKKKTRKIFPVFLPFLGCPGQCVYCAQDKQTGVSLSLSSLLGDIPARLAELPACAAGEERELAFYGGTFTSIPDDARHTCLEFLANMIRQKRITHSRCSTRPDALPDTVLRELKAYGLNLIELGIQSFDDKALRLVRRGYSGADALRGCTTVLEHEFALGIQLLPGMPGSTPEVFLNDVQTALKLHPSCMRFYPCLVPEGTQLARWFKAGKYRPWSLEDTVRYLGRALQMSTEADVPVIRLSVAPEPAFDSSLLAGPRHPALGAMIQAEALLLAAEKAARQLGRTPEGLRLPRNCRSFMYGNRGSLKNRWSAMGLNHEKIHFIDAGTQAELF